MTGGTAGVRLAVMLCCVLTAVETSAQKPGGSAQAAATSALTTLDYIEIQQLVRKYAWAIDSADNYGYAYADLFTPDGVFVDTSQGAGGRSITGRDDLAAFGRGGTKGPNHQSQFVMNHVITAGAGGATGKAYVVVLDVGISGTANGVNRGGHFDDVYDKTPVGWRFKKRTYHASKADVRPVDAPRESK